MKTEPHPRVDRINWARKMLAGWSAVRLDWRSLARILSAVRPYRLTLGLALLATLLTSALGLIFPALVGSLVDGALMRDSVTSAGTLNRTVLVLLMVFVLRAAAGAIQAYLLMSVGEGVVTDLRARLYAHLLRLPQRFFDTHRTGALTSRLSSDILTIQVVVSDVLSLLVGQLFTLLGGLYVLIRVSPRLSLVMLSVIPFVLLSAAYFGRRLERVSRDLRQQEAGTNAHAQETLHNIRVVKSFVTEAQEHVHYTGLTRTGYRLALARARVRATYAPVVGALMACSVSLVLWWGGHLVQRGELTAGHLIAFLLYTVTVTNAMSALSGVYGQVQEAIGASSAVFGLLDEASEPGQLLASGPGQISSLVQGSLRFELVSFHYDQDQLPVLHELSFEVRPGEVVALVGPSGGGKSTVAALVPRFYSPTAGRILLDGQDLQDYDLEALRRSIGTVPQDIQLFAATLRDNLRYGTPEATQAQIEAAARAAHVHNFVCALPDGYDTQVGERGVTLSGGQRQRIAIARALLKDPQVLILDEATSALDTESERLVQQALDSLMHGRTTLVIAHRLSTVKRANLILVMDAGRIVERGTHDSLMAQEGLYRLLQQQQELRPLHPMEVAALDL